MPPSPIRKKDKKPKKSGNLIKALGPGFVPKETWQTVLGWTNEYDTSDFVEVFLSSGKFPIYYNYINSLLLFIRFHSDEAGDIVKDYRISIKKDILNFFREYGNEIESIDEDKLKVLQGISEDGPSTPIFFIQHILKSAYELYHALNKFPIISIKYPRGLPTKIKTLYHGLELLEVPLFDFMLKTDMLKINTIISWPLFMSSTADLNVALRFSSKYSLGKKVLFHIQIPDTVHNIIKYTYLGKTIELDDTLVQLGSEVEFLLNMGIKLQLSDINYNIKKQFVRPEIIGSTTEEDTFDIYIFKFVDYTDMEPFFQKVMYDPKIAEAVVAKFGKSKKKNLI